MNRIKKVLQWILIIGVWLLIAEGLLRLLGFQPFKVSPFQLASTPPSCMLPHTQLGFGLNPGKFDVSINKTITYTCTHTIDSYRITQKQPIFSPKKRIDIHGCSFTYGMGVDDSLAYPFLVQQALPSLDIRNYAVPGYGTIQTLLILQQQIAQGQTPDKLILNYLDFHDERNALTPNYRNNLYFGFLKANTTQKRLFLKSQMPYWSYWYGLQFQSWKDMYQYWYGRDMSSLVHLSQKVYENINLRAMLQSKSTKSIVHQIQHLCKENDIELVIVTMSQSRHTQKMKRYWEKKGIAIISMEIDLTKPEYSFMPVDIHPNEKAHRHFATKVIPYLKR